MRHTVTVLDVTCVSHVSLRTNVRLYMPASQDKRDYCCYSSTVSPWSPRRRRWPLDKCHVRLMCRSMGQRSLGVPDKCLHMLLRTYTRSDNCVPWSTRHRFYLTVACVADVTHAFYVCARRWDMRSRKSSNGRDICVAWHVVQGCRPSPLEWCLRWLSGRRGMPAHHQRR